MSDIFCMANFFQNFVGSGNAEFVLEWNSWFRICVSYSSTQLFFRTSIIHWVVTRDVHGRDRTCSNLTRKVRTCSNSSNCSNCSNCPNKFEQVWMLVIIRTTHHGWEPWYVDRSKRKQHLSGSWLVDWAKGKQYESGSWLIVVNA